MAIILRQEDPGATQAGSLSPFYVEAEGSSLIHWIKSYFNWLLLYIGRDKNHQEAPIQENNLYFCNTKIILKGGGCIFSSIRAL